MSSNTSNAKKKAKEKIAKLGQALTECLSVSAMSAAQDIYKDEMLMYDECIEQYYTYKTTSYRRHEVGKGTGTGINLYRSNNFKLKTHMVEGVLAPVELPRWIDAYDEVNANDMDGYKPWKDQEGNLHPVDKEAILQYVLEGWRGVASPEGKFGSTTMRWTANVVSRYLGSFKGTPDEIFEAYEKKIVKVCKGRAEMYYRKYKNDYMNKIK